MEKLLNMADEKIIPFKDGVEHVISEMQLIRMMLTDKVESMAKRFESEIESAFKGYGITPAEAMYHLRNAEDGSDENKFSFNPDIVNTLRLRIEASSKEGIYLPLVKLQQLFRLSRFEVDIILTLLLPEFYPALGRVFGFLQDDATLAYPTVGFLMGHYCKNQREREFAWQVFHPGSPLKAWGLIVSIGDEMQLPPLKRAYRVDERIVTYLMGSDRFDGRLEGIAVLNNIIELNSVIKHKFTLESIVNGVMDGKECHIVTLAGNDREGANDFVEATAKRLGWKILKSPLSTLYRQKEWNLAGVELLLREAVLQPASIFLYEEPDMSGESLPDMMPLIRVLAHKGMLIFYQGDKTVTFDGVEPPINYIKLEFNYPDASERVLYWRQAIEKNNLNWPDHVAEQLAMRYLISEQKVNTVFNRLRLRLNGDWNSVDNSLELFKQVINDYSRQPLDELAHRIETVFDWNDLVVHRTVIEHLKAFRNTIAHQFTVYEKWGLGAKMPRGRGVVALFSGASGTGKTMAAEVISHDLGINLYRIDLAGLVSKYIGETEKNIKKIFDSASEANVLLFFDEADALFGRRTEIQDSHDRYANLEVSYLLQRLEEHDGPVILATNMRKNMDEAFLRRIHFIIEFPQPSESLRQIIWQKYIPPSAPKAEDVDIAFLSKHFEISGGDIRNAAVQAAFMAAEDGRHITMEHLLMTIKREYLKLGKLFPGSQVNHISKGLSESSKNRRRKKEVSRFGY